MPSTGRDLGQPIVVANRLTATGKLDEVKRLLDGHDRYLRSLPGFQGHVRVRVSEPPDLVHWQLEYWRHLGDLVAAAHDDDYLRHVRELGSLLAVDADRAVQVSSLPVARAQRVSPRFAVVSDYLVSADPEVYEDREARLTEVCRQEPGFLGRDLLRSVVRPDRYIALAWWREPAAWQRIQGLLPYQEAFAQVAYLAGIDVATSLDVVVSATPPGGP